MSCRIEQQSISILAVLADRDLRPAGARAGRRISILAVLADRDFRQRQKYGRQRFQSSRSLRTATAGGVLEHTVHLISILAVLADRDPGITIPSLPSKHFNPRGPCGPRRCFGNVRCAVDGFQSSRSLRTATRKIFHPLLFVDYFNPRGPCGPRRYQVLRIRGDGIFQSSRSLRTATRCCRAAWSSRGNFNPRGPCGPRHYSGDLYAGEVYFNPRGPCGPRPRKHLACLGIILFQSSRSLRTATSLPPAPGYHQGISILAVLADRDRRRSRSSVDPLGGQSSRSLRTATHLHSVHDPGAQISILAVLADRDVFEWWERLVTVIFQSSRSLRTATSSRTTRTGLHKNFNPRGPCGPRRTQAKKIDFDTRISILAVLADRD